MKPKKQTEERDQQPTIAEAGEPASGEREPARSYLTIPVAFGMAVVLETTPGTGFEGLAGSLG
jgi:hypothetical protein